MPHLDLVVADAEVQIRVARHDDGARCDRLQGRGEIALEPIVRADVGMLPRPQHRQQIVRVARPVALLREAQDVVDRGEPQLRVLALAVEVLRVNPSGVHACERDEALHRRRVVPAVVERRVGRQRGSQAFEEHDVVRRGARRAADRRDRADHVRKQRAPLKGLLRAHREAGDERKPADAKMLRHEPMLREDIVVDRDARKGRAVDRHGRVARRRRQAVAEHVDDDDELPRGIDRAALREHQLAVGMMGGVERGDEDDVVARRVQPAVRFISQLRLPQRRSRLKREISERKTLVISHAIEGYPV